MSASEITPVDAVAMGECEKKTNKCSFPRKMEIGAILLFKDTYGKQYNVCKNCADHLYKSREWTRPNEENISRYFVVIHDNPDNKGLTGIFIPMDIKTFSGNIVAVGNDESDVKSKLIELFRSKMQGPAILFDLDRETELAEI